MTKLTTNDLKASGYTPDDEAQNAIWAHCASITSLSTIVEMVEDEYDAEICVTTAQEAGRFDGMGFKGIGLFLKGTVTAMFCQDIGSTYDSQTMKRKFWSVDREVLVDKYEDLKNEDGKWTETLIIPTEVVSIWVTKETAQKMSDKDFARLTKRIGDYPIVIV